MSFICNGKTSYGETSVQFMFNIVVTRLYVEFQTEECIYFSNTSSNLCYLTKIPNMIKDWLGDLMLRDKKSYLNFFSQLSGIAP